MTRTVTDGRPAKHTGTVARLLAHKTPRWLLVGEYGNESSAGAISWMIRHGRGLKAFVSTPGTFTAEVRWNTENGAFEVWAKRAVK